MGCCLASLIPSDDLENVPPTPKAQARANYKKQSQKYNLYKRGPAGYDCNRRNSSPPPSPPPETQTKDPTDFTNPDLFRYQTTSAAQLNEQEQEQQSLISPVNDHAHSADGEH